MDDWCGSYVVRETSESEIGYSIGRGEVYQPRAGCWDYRASSHVVVSLRTNSRGIVAHVVTSLMCKSGELVIRDGYNIFMLSLNGVYGIYFHQTKIPFIGEIHFVFEYLNISANSL
jgi:hypothetical protein